MLLLGSAVEGGGCDTMKDKCTADKFCMRLKIMRSF